MPTSQSFQLNNLVISPLKTESETLIPHRESVAVVDKAVQKGGNLAKWGPFVGEDVTNKAELLMLVTNVLTTPLTSTTYRPPLDSPQ